MSDAADKAANVSPMQTFHKLSLVGGGCMESALTVDTLIGRMFGLAYEPLKELWSVNDSPFKGSTVGPPVAATENRLGSLLVKGAEWLDLLVLGCTMQWHQGRLDVFRIDRVRESRQVGVRGIPVAPPLIPIGNDDAPADEADDMFDFIMRNADENPANKRKRDDGDATVRAADGPTGHTNDLYVGAEVDEEPEVIELLEWFDQHMRDHGEHNDLLMTDVRATLKLEKGMDDERVPSDVELESTDSEPDVSLAAKAKKVSKRAQARIDLPLEAYLSKLGLEDLAIQWTLAGVTFSDSEKAESIFQE